MKKEETMLLLQECDAGLKMAIASIDEVLDKIGRVSCRVRVFRAV